MNLKKFIVMLAAALICGLSNVNYAQLAAPTLSAGLAAVTGTKGDIDVELLTELISQKQSELRNELLQRKLIDDMQDGSFGMTNYVYSSLYALLSLKDKKAIEKELLTQISILSLQVGLTESILQLSYKEGAPSVAMDRSLRKYIGLRYSLDELKVDSCVAQLEDDFRSTQFMMFWNVDKIIDRVVIEKYPHVKIDKKSEDLPTLKFRDILFDCVFEICRRNDQLNDLGFVKIHPNLKYSYSKNNKYLQNLDKVYELDNLVTSAVGLLVTYHPLFFEFLNDDGLSIASMVNSFDRSMWMSDVVLDSSMAIAENWVNDVSAGLDSLLKHKSITHDEAVSHAKGLNDIQAGLHEYHVRTQSSVDLINANDYIFLQEYILPFVDQMVVLGVLDGSQTHVLKKIKTELFRRLVFQVSTAIDSADHLSRFDSIPIDRYAHLIEIISSLSRLDDVRSYEHIFNSLGQIGINGLKSGDSKYIRDLVYFVETFTTINLSDNHISVEVEKLLLEFIKIYENNVSANTQAYFGMGLNQTVAVENVNNDYALRSDDSTEIKSLGFASEKIGLKQKLVNNKKRQFKRHSEGELLHMNATPVVSDWYAFAYGAGLLYNVANLTTEGSSFNESMVGIGIGAAFFNSLDISVWRSSPLSGDLSFGQNLSRGFYGISFDIKLTEYLSAVGEKRRMSKLRNQ